MGFKKKNEIVENQEVNQETTVDEEKKPVEDFPIERSEEIVSDQSEKEISDSINKEREAFLKKVKKQKIINYSVTGGLFAILVVLLVLALTIGGNKENQWITIAVLVIALLLLIATWLFSKFQRKKIDALQMNYSLFIYETTYKAVFKASDKEDRFKDTKVSLKENFRETFLKNKLYLKINEFNSIDVVSGEMRINEEFVHFDSFLCFAAHRQKNEGAVKFLGRMFVFDYKNKYIPKFRLSFQKKGGKYSFPIDDLEGVKLVEGTDKYNYYSSDPKRKSVLNKKTISLINQIKLDKNIYDVVLAINEGKLYIGIDYSDELINPPTDKVEFKPYRITLEKELLDQVIAICESIYSSNDDVEFNTTTNETVEQETEVVEENNEVTNNDEATTKNEDVKEEVKDKPSNEEVGETKEENKE